jgi:hypothetical protein
MNTTQQSRVTQQQDQVKPSESRSGFREEQKNVSPGIHIHRRAKDATVPMAPSAREQLSFRL